MQLGRTLRFATPTVTLAKPRGVAVKSLAILAAAFLLGSALLLGNGSSAIAAPTPTLLASGLEGGSGSTIGPGGAIYVTESAAGRVSRVNPKTGAVTTFAEGLPPSIIGLGGAMDVAFMGKTAYVLVTLVGPDVGGSDVVGIYRVDGPNSFTVIADIGAWAIANPPAVFDVPSGLQYALETYRGGFLVTDGHHNRVLRVGLDGEVSEFKMFGNIVPTGLALHGDTVYMAQAGAVPHLPADGKVVSFKRISSAVKEVASGAPLLVDVEFGRGRTLYALSQGTFTPGNPAGAPANADTGSLVKVNKNGTFTTIVDGLDRPTSLEISGKTAFVVTLDGEVWKINVGGSHGDDDDDDDEDDD